MNIKGMLKKLAKWVVKHGQEELEKELDRDRTRTIDRHDPPTMRFPPK